MLLTMFILPLFSVTGYSLIRNTLSDLGAQSAPNAWIMNSVFVSLAAGSVIAGWEYFEGFMLQRIILVLLGISLTLMAFFNHAPVIPDVKFNIGEDGWHAYFAVYSNILFHHSLYHHKLYCGKTTREAVGQSHRNIRHFFIISYV